MNHMGIRPPSGVKESCIELTLPLEAAVVALAQMAELAMPKRVSLPSMLPPDCRAPARRRRPSPRTRARPLAPRRLRRPPAARRSRASRPARPSPAACRRPSRRTCSTARPRSAGWPGISKKFDKRRRVLERVGRVHVEESAAVGAELLDRDLRRGRSHGQRLRRVSWRRRRRRVGSTNLDFIVGLEVLNDALRHQSEGAR